MKIAIATVAAFAGLASASPFFSGTSTTAGAQPVTVGTRAIASVNLGGSNSWDLQGSSFNEILSSAIGAGSQVTAIGWDNVTISTVGASWISEASVNFEDAVFLTFGPSETFPGTATYSSGGLVDLVGLGLDFTVADGSLTMELFDSFDDVSGAIDANYLSGTLTISYIPVPAPSALALVGLGGLVATRRRR